MKRATDLSRFLQLVQAHLTELLPRKRCTHRGDACVASHACCASELLTQVARSVGHEAIPRRRVRVTSLSSHNRGECACVWYRCCGSARCLRNNWILCMEDSPKVTSQMSPGSCNAWVGSWGLGHHLAVTTISTALVHTQEK